MHTLQQGDFLECDRYIFSFNLAVEPFAESVGVDLHRDVDKAGSLDYDFLAGCLLTGKQS